MIVLSKTVLNSFCNVAFERAVRRTPDAKDRFCRPPFLHPETGGTEYPPAVC